SDLLHEACELGFAALAPRKAYAFPLHCATSSRCGADAGCFTRREMHVSLEASHGSRMKPAPFRYHAPRTVDEAVALLPDGAPQDGRVLAGGQSLVPIMAFRLSKPAHLVDINGVEALRRLAVEGDRLCIGACVRHAAFHRPVVEGPLGELLTAVVRHIAHYPI